MGKILFNTAEPAKTDKYAEGKAVAKIADAFEGSASTGTGFIQIDWYVPDRDITVKKKFWLTPSALNELKKLYSALGLYQEGEDIDFNKLDLIGEWFEINLIKGEANAEGKRYLEVEHYGFKKCNAPVKVAEEPKAATSKAPF